MAAEHYELSGSALDSMNNAAQASPQFDVYLPNNYSYYENTDTTAQVHLPEFTIGDFSVPVSDVLSNEQPADMLFKDDSSEKSTAKEKQGETVFHENEDGTYTHIVEKGDTYWNVARTVLMAQSGAENPDDVKKSDILQMMNKLLEYNGKPTSGDGANRLAIGEAINIPKGISDFVEVQQDGKLAAEPAEKNKKGQSQTEQKEHEELKEQEALKNQKELLTTMNGAKADGTMLNPHDGVYSPLQPPGLESGQNGDYDMQGYWNYDVEGRQIVSDTTNAKNGMRTLTYSGQIDSGYGANTQWWNDTPYDATEMINANGVITQRNVNYHDSSVKMNFDDGAGNNVDAYVSSVRSDLEVSTGNYKTVITTAEGQVYQLQVDGKTGLVIRDET